MPSRNTSRSSSASGRLETLRDSSILSELGGSGCSGERTDVSEKGKQQPEWSVRELLKQNRRRHSLVSLGDEGEIMRLQHFRSGSSHSLEIDEKISLDSLQKLKLAFEEYEAAASQRPGGRDFGRLVKKCLPNTTSAQIQGLFKKIDYSGRGRISWGEFCAHVLQVCKEKEKTARRSKQVVFTLPAATRPLCHSSPVVSIHCSLDDVITVREDGAVCCWSPELKPRRTKHMFSGRPEISKWKWASDSCLMPDFNKLLIGTGDREIQLYELSTLAPYCQINTLDTIPLTLDYGYTGADQCCVLYGDTEGCVNIILISSVEDTLRVWNKFPKVGNLPTVAIDNAVLSPNVTFVRWKVHQDWVTQAKYLPSLKAVVSSSNEEASSLVIGCALPLTDADQRLREIEEACYEGKIKKVQLSWTPQTRASCDQTVFTVHKGVKTFDLCQKHSLLVTGGMDRLIRMWNPHNSGTPTRVLRGHSAPVTYLCISSEDSQVFSVSVDGAAKIWDIQDQCCLFTADPKASGIHADISACLYSPALKALYVAADSMALLPLRMRPEPRSHVTVSHEESVTCCGYSEMFRQVVSCTEGSVVRVWDLDTGHQVFEFGGDLRSAITCMTFDPEGRRLITGGKDGCLKVWNFNNGQCLNTLTKDGRCHEVCDCIYLKLHRNSYVMSVGRDRKIDIYSDEAEDPRHVRRPQPSWQDDLRNGHQADVLCVAHCPPSLLATSSWNGEIIVWNLVSGCVHSRLVSPPPAEYQHVEDLDVSVPSLLFHRSSRLQQSCSAAALLSSGIIGCINVWNILGGGKFVSSFKASRFRQKITKMAGTCSLLFAADRIGYVYVYNMEEFDLGPEKQPPRAESVWRAHTSTVTGLQLVDRDQVVLTSSTDFTVRLWSPRGEFIGTFGQADSWSVHLSSSWMHPAVPYEVLIDPLSMPDHEILNVSADRGELKALSLNCEEY